MPDEQPVIEPDGNGGVFVTWFGVTTRETRRIVISNGVVVWSDDAQANPEP